MRSQSRVHALDDFDVITGPPAPPANRQKTAEPPQSAGIADPPRGDKRGAGEQQPMA